MSQQAEPSERDEAQSAVYQGSRVASPAMDSKPLWSTYWNQEPSSFGRRFQTVPWNEETSPRADWLSEGDDPDRYMTPYFNPMASPIKNLDGSPSLLGNPHGGIASFSSPMPRLNQFPSYPSTDWRSVTLLPAAMPAEATFSAGFAHSPLASPASAEQELEAAKDNQHPRDCRPCAFFWTKGCNNGAACRFCHEWHPPKKKKPMKEQKNLMIIARPDGRIEFMRCTVQEALLS